MSKCKIISIAMQKGGTGKTTSCINIGAVLVDMGYRVLMVDNDEEAALTESTGLNPYDLKPSLSDVYLGTASASDAIYTTSMENLHILPADMYFATIETELSKTYGLTQSRFLKLKHELTGIEDAYDFIIIDNHPTLGFGLINSLYASDYVLIPSSPSPKDVNALPLLYSTINDVMVHEKKKKKLKILGVLITKYRQRVKLHEDGKAKLENNPTYRVIGTIMNSAEAEMEYEGLPVSVYRKNSKVSQQYQEATRKIMDIIKEEEANEAK